MFIYNVYKNRGKEGWEEEERERISNIHAINFLIMTNLIAYRYHYI